MHFVALFRRFEIRVVFPQIVKFPVCGLCQSRLAKRLYAFPPFFNIRFLLFAAANRFDHSVVFARNGRLWGRELSRGTGLRWQVGV